jgi:ATP-dependent Lhr-like helicase
MQSFQFHPAVRQWFEQTFGSPTEPQLRGWPAIQSGRHVLISAPTGSGKTLAAFLASLDALFREGAQADLPDETQIVYVSPLKALSNDIRKNLQEPLVGIRALLHQANGRAIDVRAEVRTGDTTAAQRQALIKKAAAHPRYHTGVPVSAAHIRVGSTHVEHSADADYGRDSCCRR